MVTFASMFDTVNTQVNDLAVQVGQTPEYNILPSMSRAGNPLDNAPAENFFSILKTECINRTKSVDFQDAKIMIHDYINFYNFERIQLKTKLTPFEKRCQFNAI